MTKRQRRIGKSEGQQIISDKRPSLDSERSSRRLFAFSTGTTSVEYALMIAIVVGATLAVTRAVGEASQHVYNSPPLVSHTLGTRPDALPSQNSNRLGSGEQAPSSGASTATVNNPWRLPLEIGVIGLIGGLLVVERRKNKNFSVAENATEAPSASAKGDAAFDAAKQRIFDKRQTILHAVSADTAALFNSQMDVRHLMTAKVTRVFLETPAEKVQKLFRVERLRHLMVCDASDKLVGVISDRDLRKANARTAEQLMTPDPETASPDDLIGPAITRLMNLHVSCLPVIENGRLCGVLTSTDLMMALQCCLQILRAATATEAETNETAIPDQHPSDWKGVRRKLNEDR